MTDHNKFIDLVIEEAKKAFNKDEVPVGAVIVKDGLVIASAHNLRESSNSALAHAEILAIKKANKFLNSWRLEDCSLYISLEPCPMCAGAIIQSRIKNVYYFTKDLKTGSAGSIIDLFEIPFTHKVNVEKLNDEGRSKELIQSFFKKLRK